MALQSILYNLLLICWVRKLVSRGAMALVAQGWWAGHKREEWEPPTLEAIAFSTSSPESTLDYGEPYHWK